jgi:hypothetical protein
LKKLGWKVVLRKEARSKKEMANVKDVFITTTINPNGLNAMMGLSPPPTVVSLIGVIQLSDKNNLLACAKF